MIILGIETSCDETSAAIVKSDGNTFDCLSNIIHSQIDIHAQYGGVIPEVAARLHVEKIMPIVEKAIDDAQITKDEITAIAVTAGPGMVTSLLVGIQTARILAHQWKKPLIAVNHMEGHLASALFSTQKKSLQYPLLGLLVSGGHTELIYSEKWGNYSIIGETRDDAIGESYDKVAKILGLPYPGGPKVDALAQQTDEEFTFPRPMLHSDNLDLSYSGLKTSVLYKVKELEINNGEITEYDSQKICRGFQNAAIDVLLQKTKKAIKKYSIKTFILGGGVSANKELRKKLETMIKDIDPEIQVIVPEFKYCTDNAAMIAAAGIHYAENNHFTKLTDLEANPVWTIGTDLSERD